MEDLFITIRSYHMTSGSFNHALQEYIYNKCCLHKVGMNIVVYFPELFRNQKIKTMKDFATACIAALLMAGFYALGSVSAHDSPKIDQSKIYRTTVTDAVPQKDDTLNKKMPKDTMSRRGTP